MEQAIVHFMSIQSTFQDFCDRVAPQMLQMFDKYSMSYMTTLWTRFHKPAGIYLAFSNISSRNFFRIVLGHVQMNRLTAREYEISDWG